MPDTSPEAVERILSGGPTETVELKARLPADADLGATLSAFANTSGGTLIIGANERGEVIGLSDEEARYYSARIRLVAQSLLPNQFKVSEVEVNSNKLVFAFVEPVSPSGDPVMTARGEIYARDRAETICVSVMKSNRRTLQEKQFLPSDVTDKTWTTFVAMSFRDEEDPSLVDYYQAIKRAADKSVFKIELRRVDLLEGHYEISQYVMDEIDRADLIIADFTLNPPNVYFELGYARARRKSIIQTARKGTLLEFDVRNWRTLFYRNATELEAKLVSELDAAFTSLTRQETQDGV